MALAGAPDDGLDADESEAPTSIGQADDKNPDQRVWSGIVLPLLGANSQDGFGFGLGGEVFNRKRSATEGYALKITGSLWVTTSFEYTSDFLQIDYRGRTHWVGRLGYRGWANHAYAGVGGADVLLQRPDAEVGNQVRGPFGFLGASREIRDHLSWFTQLYYKTYWVDAGRGSLLEQERPFGANGGTYVDATGGIELDTTDRWPMPTEGIRTEASIRAGATFGHAGQMRPLVGGNAEVIAWEHLGDHVVFGGRFVVDQTFGDRPFFEGDIGGGRWRDELGSEQMFSGYGRTRTRGTGFIAGAVEFRPYFFRIDHPVLDFAFHASAFAELGWLTDRDGIGPVLPSVGVGPEIVFQGAIQCRPFLAWGWRADAPGQPRRPVSQFGISFLNPL